MGRRFYDEEFKRNAVELLEADERSAVQLGTGIGRFGLFLRQAERNYGRQACDGLKGSEAEQSRNKEPDRQLAAVA